MLLLWGTWLEEHAALIGPGRRGLLLLLHAVALASLGVCCQVSRGITERITPKSDYYNAFLFCCVQSWQWKMMPGYANYRSFDLKIKSVIKPQWNFLAQEAHGGDCFCRSQLSGFPESGVHEDCWSSLCTRGSSVLCPNELPVLDLVRSSLAWEQCSFATACLLPSWLSLTSSTCFHSCGRLASRTDRYRYSPWEWRRSWSPHRCSGE